MRTLSLNGSPPVAIPMRATMQDIARECGVTKMTVSRVLAGRQGVKATTREKILDAANRLNYEVNTLAQNLNFNRSGFIGVATNLDYMLGSPYLAEVFRGFRQGFAMDDSGLNYALFDTGSDSFNTGAKLAKLYRQKRIDGLLIVALHISDHFLDTLAELHMPMVVVGEKAPSRSICSVSCDDQRGVNALCAHLYALGHRRIAYVDGPPDVSTANRRKQAYAAFCRAKKLKNPAWYIYPGNYSMQSGRIAGRALLTARPRPTAIIAANDMMAYGLIESAHELNLSIPGDVSIGGFDDLPTAAERCPSLTTIHQPVKEMGERSAKIVLQSLNSGVPPTGQTIMDVSLVVRESTAACCSGRSKR